MNISISDEQRKEIGMKIRTWILSRSNVSKFCRDEKLAKSTVDKWLSGTGGPSLQSAIHLENISNGELKREFLCPQYDW